jgi:hypothetical protein
MTSMPWLRLLPFAGYSLEELVSHEAESLGPTVIIGDPGERLPRLGASREYLADKDWKTEVSKLIEETALLIFVLADTENLFWEFQTAITKGRKDRLLLIVPPVRREHELRSRWQHFIETNAKLLGPGISKHLPQEPVIALFFWQGEPVLIISEKRTGWHYVLAIRLFIYIYSQNLPSGSDMTRFLRASVPSVLEEREYGRWP